MVDGFLWITQNICSISLLEMNESSSCCWDGGGFLSIFSMLSCTFWDFFIILVFCVGCFAKRKPIFTFPEHLCLLKFGHIFFSLVRLHSFYSTNWNYPHTFWYCLPMWLPLCVWNISVERTNINKKHQICLFFGCEFRTIRFPLSTSLSPSFLSLSHKQTQGKKVKLFKSKLDSVLKHWRIFLDLMNMFNSSRFFVRKWMKCMNILLFSDGTWVCWSQSKVEFSRNLSSTDAYVRQM